MYKITNITKLPVHIDNVTILPHKTSIIKTINDTIKLQKLVNRHLITYVKIDEDVIHNAKFSKLNNNDISTKLNNNDISTTSNTENVVNINNDTKEININKIEKPNKSKSSNKSFTKTNDDVTENNN